MVGFLGAGVSRVVSCFGKSPNFNNNIRGSKVDTNPFLLELPELRNAVQPLVLFPEGIQDAFENYPDLLFRIAHMRLLAVLDVRYIGQVDPIILRDDQVATLIRDTGYLETAPGFLNFLKETPDKYFIGDMSLLVLIERVFELVRQIEQKSSS